MLKVSLLSLLIIFHVLPGVFAQKPADNGYDDVSGSQEIKWIKQVPHSDEKKKAGFFNRVSEIIVGFNPETVKKPFAVVADSPDLYWFLDQENRTLMISQDDGFENILNTRKSGFVFPSLIDLCRLPDGSILFTDSKNNKIYRLIQDKKEVEELNSSLVLDQPTGIAYSREAGEIWVVETGAHCIVVLSDEGEFKRRLGRRGTIPGEFNFPTSIWIDNGGIVYVVDAMNFRIQILDKDGNPISTFGEPGNATGYFARPKGIATDSYGNIYIVDALFHAVQVFNKKGELLDYFGSQGQNKGQFWLPSGIFIDENDYIYISDSYNSRIQIFQASKLNPG